MTTYDCGDIVTTFLHKETKLTRRKFEWVEHNILEFLVKTFCIPLLWWFKGNVEYLTLNFFVIKLLTLKEFRHTSLFRITMRVTTVPSMQCKIAPLQVKIVRPIESFYSIDLLFDSDRSSGCRNVRPFVCSLPVLSSQSFGLRISFQACVRFLNSFRRTIGA